MSGRELNWFLILSSWILGFVKTIVKEKMYFLGLEYMRGHSKGRVV
jgi:hypothetical protein